MELQLDQLCRTRRTLTATTFRHFLGQRASAKAKIGTLYATELLGNGADINARSKYDNYQYSIWQE